MFHTSNLIICNQGKSMHAFSTNTILLDIRFDWSLTINIPWTLRDYKPLFIGSTHLVFFHRSSKVFDDPHIFTALSSSFIFFFITSSMDSHTSFIYHHPFIRRNHANLHGTHRRDRPNNAPLLPLVGYFISGLLCWNFWIYTSLSVLSLSVVIGGVYPSFLSHPAIGSLRFWTLPRISYADFWRSGRVYLSLARFRWMEKEGRSEGV